MMRMEIVRGDSSASFVLVAASNAFRFCPEVSISGRTLDEIVVC
jgi:hypothetical protein